MNTIEAMESRTAAAKAPGMIEEEMQKKIDEGLARLVMVDKLCKHFAARAACAPKRSAEAMIYTLTVTALEAVRSPEVEELRHWQQDRDALKRQIGEEAGNTGNTGNTMSTGVEAGEAIPAVDQKNPVRMPCPQAYTALYRGESVKNPENVLFAQLRSMADEIAADTIMALEAAHPDIWEDRETWKEILLEDARKIENFLQEEGE